MTSLLQELLHVPAPLVLSAIAALVFGEAAFFLGFVVPGETAVLLGGFLASTGRLSLTLLCVVVVVSAIVGDTVGYEVGRTLGPRMLRTRMLRNHQHRVQGARAFLDGRGASAVFVGRFTAFLRAVTPGLAGLSHMRYRRFLAYNAAGGLVWGLAAVFAGYLAGSSYEQVAHHLGQGGAIAVAAFVVLALVGWHWRRRRHRRAETAAAGSDGSTEGTPAETSAAAPAGTTAGPESATPAATDGAAARRPAADSVTHTS